MSYPGFGWQQYCQFGKMVTAETPVAATLRCPVRNVTVGDQIAYYRAVTQSGDVDPGHSVAPGGLNVPVTIEMDLYLQHSYFFLDALFGNATATSPAAPNAAGKVRTWSTGTTVIGPRLTMEWYEAPDAWRVDDLILTSVSFSGSDAGQCNMTLAGFARQKANLGSMTALSIVDDLPMMAWRKALFLDAAGATPGTTEIDNALYGFTYTFNRTAAPVYNRNRSQRWGQVGRGPYAVTGSIQATIPSSRWQNTEYQAGTAQIIQTLIQGPIITGVGATEYQRIEFNMSGQWEARDSVQKEGINSLNLVYGAKRDAVLGASAQIKLVNLVA